MAAAAVDLRYSVRAVPPRGARCGTRRAVAYMPFVMQRISIAVQLAAALEIRQALGVGLAPE